MIETKSAFLNRVEVVKKAEGVWDVLVYYHDICQIRETAYSRDNAMGKADVLADNKLPVIVHESESEEK